MIFTPFTSDFDSRVADTLRRWHVPGVAFSVLHKESTWSKGYGLADVESNIPVEPSTTLFFGASTTKAHLCAAWAMYLASDANQSKPPDERIGWRTPMATIIPGDFILSDPARTAEVTLEDCLSHRTGLPRHEMSTKKGGDKILRQITRTLRYLPMHNALREEHEYCNQMFFAASYALEVVTAKPLSAFMKEVLWHPLGMHHTYGGLREVHEAGVGVAQGYSWSKFASDSDWKNAELIKESPLNGSERSGAGFIVSTVEDYAKWMRAFLHPSTGPLNDDIVKSVWTPRSLVSPTDSANTNIPFEGVMAYGLGWFITTYKSHTVYWHSGEIDGYGALVMLVPSLDLGVSFLSNGQTAHTSLKGLAVDLVDVLLGDYRHSVLKMVESSFLNSDRDKAEKIRTARQRLYPGAPSTPIVPLALPVKCYAGRYCNIAYGPITLNLVDGGDSMAQFDSTTYLACRTMENHSLPRTFSFTHINAENWLVTKFDTGSAVVNPDRSPYRTALRAETRVNSLGRVVSYVLYVLIIPVCVLSVYDTH
jgi:CubicO group peptidase (beta-lactamase class C family)